MKAFVFEDGSLWKTKSNAKFSLCHIFAIGVWRIKEFKK